MHFLIRKNENRPVDPVGKAPSLLQLGRVRQTDSTWAS